MKIRNYLTIAFAVLAIIFLIGLAGFMTVYVADDSNPVKQQILEILPFDLPGLSEAETAAPEETSEQSASGALPAHSLVFVGDSRAIGMQEAVGDACTYLGAEGEGYEWFASEGITELSALLSDSPAQTVILNLGVNDPKNISLYIDLYQSLMTEYPDASFYILSVNPLVDSDDFNTTNEMIELFNATMESAFPENYIDSYSYLNEDGFETVDGLHYTEEIYRKIHDLVVRTLT